MDPLLQQATSVIESATGKAFALADAAPVGGGCIHHATRLQGTDDRRFFLKRNQIGQLDAFEAESTALEILHQSGPVRFPRPIGVCSTRTEAGLILEFLPLGGRSSDEGFARLGSQLARLHRHSAEQFGWPTHNYIGAATQLNTWESDWITFYRDYRLLPQIRRARQKGLDLPEADQLLDNLHAFFPGPQPVPSLLHGDLWSGNADFLKDGSPCLFDPASYYGDRETDLAMTEMFGGFPKAFYRAYDKEWPIDEGYRLRKNLYILYHLLNHFNLFGGGYGASARSSIRSLLSSVSS